jgi:hypothetical protein
LEVCDVPLQIRNLLRFGLEVVHQVEAGVDFMNQFRQIFSGKTDFGINMALYGFKKYCCP